MAQRYFLLNKPYGYLSQFTREQPEHRTLADLYNFPPDVYPVGRLDQDSEGLLLLTNDRQLTHRLLDPSFGHWRSYWIQVEGIPNEQALLNLRQGPRIRIKGKEHRSLPTRVRLINEPPNLWPRNPPIRERQNIPTSWLEIELQEGKNRQVRRMAAAVGLPVLRLIRFRIELPTSSGQSKYLTLNQLAPGELQELLNI
jgi:23S rRNA pseudouridine2457 synthase